MKLSATIIGLFISMNPLPSSAATSMPPIASSWLQDIAAVTHRHARTAHYHALASSASARPHTYPDWWGPPNGYNVPYIYPPDNHPHSPNPAWDVYDTRGRYVGSDPDPFIRSQLARDPAQNN
jgi:hypothetical protein